MGLSKSPSINAALALSGIFTEEDVLSHLPRRYENLALSEDKDLYEDKEHVVLEGSVRNKGRMIRFASRSLVSFYFETKGGHTLLVEAWNRPYLLKMLTPNVTYTLVGLYNLKRHSISLINFYKGSIPLEHKLKPYYSLPNEVPNRSFALLVEHALKDLKGHLLDVVPPYFKDKYRLESHYEALRLAHQPLNYDDVHKGLRVLKYEEALSFSLKTALVRGENKALVKDSRRKINQEMVASFIKSLPYKLSEDQATVCQECFKDMDSSHVMYRLLQGDVGTGKTLVAALLAYANHTRSEQTALMAPTDALARQHYDNLRKLFQGSNLQIALLVGSMSSEERAAVLTDLADGTIDLVIGTQALFSKGVTYAYLGLAIIDEQHKFGVNQRSLLLDKGEHADLLLMSATPIPRTLALTIYGDLDVSSLYQFPTGARHVTTKIVPSTDSELLASINASLASNHRVYIVTPQIEGNGEETTSVKKVYAKFKKLYPNKVTMMHGAMDDESKQVAMAAFKSGLCPILVATSLIEVGIDVKEANLMLIYSPTHFALSSLHQLRGRIGRDGSEAQCYLVCDEGEEEDKEKLEVLVSTNDGFKIAEADLKMRGPGELAGTKQSGLPDFAYANIINDFKIFECARDDAAFILKHQESAQFQDLLARAKRDAASTSIA